MVGIIEGIIFLIVMIVATELFYYKVALKYDFFDWSDGEVKVKKKNKKAYRFHVAGGYKFISLIIGAAAAIIVLEIIHNFKIEHLIDIGKGAAIILGVSLFFWINWIFTKRRQGGQVPEQKMRYREHF